MAKSRALLVWLYALSLIAIAFIWGNSLLSKDASGAFSSAVETWLLRFFRPLTCANWRTFANTPLWARFPARPLRSPGTIPPPAC